MWSYISLSLHLVRYSRMYGYSSLVRRLSWSCSALLVIFCFALQGILLLLPRLFLGVPWNGGLSISKESRAQSDCGGPSTEGTSRLGRGTSVCQGKVTSKLGFLQRFCRRMPAVGYNFENFSLVQIFMSNDSDAQINHNFQHTVYLLIPASVLLSVPVRRQYSNWRPHHVSPHFF
jgi:hypothetical protein